MHGSSLQLPCARLLTYDVRLARPGRVRAPPHPQGEQERADPDLSAHEEHHEQNPVVRRARVLYGERARPPCSPKSQHGIYKDALRFVGRMRGMMR